MQNIHKNIMSNFNYYSLGNNKKLPGLSSAIELCCYCKFNVPVSSDRTVKCYFKKKKKGAVELVSVFCGGWTGRMAEQEVMKAEKPMLIW